MNVIPINMSDEVWALVRAIESGEVTLIPETEAQDIYAGNLHYKSSNGWEVVVFNDCNEWDYFDTFIAPDGRKLEFDDMPEGLMFYTPGDDIAWKAYGIPGYMQHRDESWKA